MVRGECFRIKAPRGARGSEIQGERYGVVVQSDLLIFESSATVLIAPTSRSARMNGFRPEVDFGNGSTKVLTEQTAVYSLDRIGSSVGRLSADDMIRVDDALKIVFGLR